MSGKSARKRKNANSDQQVVEHETGSESQEGLQTLPLVAVQNQMNSVSETEEKEDKSNGAKKRRISNRYKRKPKAFLNEAAPTTTTTTVHENENEEEVEPEKKDDEFDPESDEKPKQPIDDPSKPKKQYQRKPRRRLITRRIGGKLPVETVKALRGIEWRELDFIGLEIKGVNEIKDDSFQFPDLIHELVDGVLADVDPVYMFMGAQPITVGETVKNIPYIVAIDCKRPPSGRIAITSIQSGTELIEPLSKWHLSWIPYMPKKFAYATADTPAQIHVLAWEERRSKLSRYNEEKVHKVSLLLPYELLPHMFEAEPLERRLELVKSVDFQFKAENGHTFGIVWDKEAHKLSVDVDVLIEDEKLPESEKPRIKQALKDEFERARQKVREKYEREKAELESLKPEDLQALKNIKLYKFYPVHPSLDIKPHMVSDINRYYGKATKVFPELPDLTNQPKPADTVQQFTAPSTVEVNPNSNGFVFQSSAAQTSSINNFMLPSKDDNNNSNAFAKASFTLPQSTSGFSVPSTGFSVPSTGFTVPSSGFSIPTTGFTPAPDSTQTTGFVFTGAVSDSSTADSADSWKCAACQTKNKLTVKTCDGCMLQRP